MYSQLPLISCVSSGKTRWGNEFFNSVKKDWGPPPSWEKPEYLYLFLDFIGSVRLSSFDIYLDASTILGLRIAYEYFAHKEMMFEIFKALAEPFIKLFKIEWVLIYIQSLLNRRLILVLHIEEYQEIITFEDSWKEC